MEWEVRDAEIAPAAPWVSFDTTRQGEMLSGNGWHPFSGQAENLVYSFQ